jgi:hypothetical protein
LIEHWRLAAQWLQVPVTPSQLHDKDMLDDGEQRWNETDEACSSEDDGQHSDRKKRT